MYTIGSWYVIYLFVAVFPPRVRVYEPVENVDVGERVEFTCRADGDLLSSIEWIDSRGIKIEKTSRGQLIFDPVM